VPRQLSGCGRSDRSSKLTGGLESETTAGFRSRRRDGHDQIPVTPHNALFASYKRLNVTPEAIRARAIRGHWRRQVGNDGLARVMVPTEILRTPDQRPVNGRSTPVRKAGDQATLTALREHIATGRQADQEQHQEQLAAARATADKATAELVELARRLAAIAETSAKPEPPRRWAIRAWRWMQKTA
jgi:hypothetical protein